MGGFCLERGGLFYQVDEPSFGLGYRKVSDRAHVLRKM